MRCGVCLSAMNYTAWEAFDETDASGRWVAPPIPDHQIVREDLTLGVLADRLGFDSLWTVEHRASPYNMVTSPLQWLTYFAGATSRIDFGTMVIVLPWHHPVRVAEDITMLHNILGDERRLTVGVGRGAGRREFGALDIPMGESRERFLEGLEIVRGLLSNEVFSHEGQHYRVPRMSLRPRPRDGRQLAENIYCAWGSPQTVPIAADAGLKPLVIALKSWTEYAQDLEQFQALRSDKGLPPVKPIVAFTLYCNRDEEQARAGAERYFGDYTDAAIRSYELYSPHFGQTKGYESYAQADGGAPDRAALEAGMLKTWVENHVWGTPEMCLARIREINDMISPSEIIVLPRIGSMGLEVATESLSLFAEQVLPAVRDL